MTNPHRYPAHPPLVGLVLFCFAIAGLVGGCRGAQTEDDAGPTPTTAAQPQPEATPLGGQDDAGPDLPRPVRDLVIWVPDFMAPESNPNAGIILTRVFSRFQIEHPDLELQIQPKAETGQASILNYLRTAHHVAPEVLPDVVLLETQDLWQVIDMGLVEPLAAEAVEPSQDLYPFALDAVRYDGQIYGYPFSAGLEHLVYYRDRIPESPATWTELFALEQHYLFPAGGRGGSSNDFVLLQYVGAGGELTPDGRLTDPEALEAVFEFLVQGRQNDTIPATALNLASAGSVWSIFASGSVALANIPASFYLAQQETVGDIGFGYTPTRMGRPISIGHVWAFAVLTDDPQKQQLILALLEALLDPSVQGEWSRFAHRLPTQRRALETWEQGHSYYEFLAEVLEITQALPNGRDFADFSRRLQQAQRGILAGELTPADALMEVQATP